MERKKNPGYLIGIILSILTFLNPAASGSDNTHEKIYEAYVSGNISAWIPVIRQLEKSQPASTKGKLELLNYYYGYTGYLISVDKFNLAELYIERAEKLMQEIVSASPDNATVYAYMGSFLGFRIGMNKFKAPVLGPKSLEYIDRSIAMDPDNAQGFLEKGNASYYTPSLFGGSKEDAIRYYNRAIQLLEATGQTKSNWLYLNALTILAQAYEKTDRRQEAEAMYSKILRLEPQFKWVRDELYPNFLNNS